MRRSDVELTAGIPVTHGILSLPSSVIARLVRATHFYPSRKWVARMKRAMTK
jgi:hypothetical protein